jgi:hypothetical protein
MKIDFLIETRYSRRKLALDKERLISDGKVNFVIDFRGSVDLVLPYGA